MAGLGTFIGVGATLAGRLIPNFRTWYLENKDSGEIIQGQFEPDATNREVEAVWEEVSSLNRQNSIMMFLHGKQEKLSITSTFFRRDALDTNVADRIDTIISWTKIDPKMHRPPILQFWIGGSKIGPIAGFAAGAVGQAIAGGGPKEAVVAAISGAVAGSAKEHINMDVVLNKVSGISYGPPDFFGGVRKVEFQMDMTQHTPFSLEDDQVFDTRYHRARERDYYELLTVFEYGDPLLGDIIRKQNPKIPLLSPGDVVRLPNIASVRLTRVTQTSIALKTAYGRKATPQRTLRLAAFNRDRSAISYVLPATEIVTPLTPTDSLQRVVNESALVLTDVVRINVHEVVISDGIGVTDQADVPPVALVGGAIIWFDAADASNYVLVADTSLVMTNKAGTGIATFVSDGTPSLINASGLNGKSSVEFELANEEHLVISGTPAYDSGTWDGAFTTYIVVQNTDLTVIGPTSPNRAWWGLHGFASGEDVFHGVQQIFSSPVYTGDNGGIRYRNMAEGFEDVFASASGAVTPTIEDVDAMILVVKRNTSSPYDDAVSLYLNGAKIADEISQAELLKDMDGTGLIGAIFSQFANGPTNPSYFAEGYFGDFVHYISEHTDQQIADNTAYLASKWNIPKSV